MKAYTDLRLLDLAGAAEKGTPVVPDLACLTVACHERGNEGANLAVSGQSETPESQDSEPDETAPMAICGPCAGGGGGGTRTHDHGLKRPMLYRLSYAPDPDADLDADADSTTGAARAIERSRDGARVRDG